MKLAVFMPTMAQTALFKYTALAASGEGTTPGLNAFAQIYTTERAGLAPVTDIEPFVSKVLYTIVQELETRVSYGHG